MAHVLNGSRIEFLSHQDICLSVAVIDVETSLQLAEMFVSEL